MVEVMFASFCRLLIIFVKQYILNMTEPTTVSPATNLPIFCIRVLHAIDIASGYELVLELSMYMYAVTVSLWLERGDPIYPPLKEFHFIYILMGYED